MRRIDTSLATLHDITDRQFGVFTLPQAVDAGLARHTVYRLSSRGLWLPVHALVFRMAAAPATRQADVLAAVLAVRSRQRTASSGGPRTVVASHGTALEMLGVAGVPAQDTIHVTVHRGGALRLKGVTIHRTVTLDPVDQVVAHGVIPVTSGGRSLVDLAATCEERRGLRRATPAHR